jgi:hypothetical protein
MSAIPFTSLYAIIAPYCKKVTQPGMDAAIRESAREFCYQTKFRRQSIVQDINLLQRDYPLIPTNTDEECLEVEAAQASNSYGHSWPLSPCQPEQLPNGNEEQANGRTPRAFWLNIPSVISLWPLPQTGVANGLSVRCVLQPTETATTLDASMYQQANRTIAWGALSRLLSRNGEPYTNVELADEYELKYQRGIGKAMTDVGFGFQAWNQTTATYRY